MRLSIIFLVIFMLTGPAFVWSQHQPVTVAVVMPSDEWAERKALEAFFKRYPAFEPAFFSPDQLPNNHNFIDYQVLWVHQTNWKLPVSHTYGDSTVAALTTLIANGRSVLITQEAVPLISMLKLDTLEPQVQTADARDEGYGRKRGLHANRSHPLFEGLQGGSFVFSPLIDTSVRRWGYFGEEVPVNGKVVAVDWAYIRMKEKERLAVSFLNPSGAEVLCIGAYCAFHVPNHHQPQLDRLMVNALNHLASLSKSKTMYWPTGQFRFLEALPGVDNVTFGAGQPFSIPLVQPIVSKKTSNEYAGLGSERLAVFSNESEGIEEVWVHPFMAFRDYRIGLRSGDSVRWLSASWFRSDAVTVRREYQVLDQLLSETIVAHPSEPFLNVHYDFQGSQALEMVVEFATNLRLMWPYSQDAIGGIDIGLSPDNQFFVASTLDKACAVAVGLNLPAKAQVSFDSTRYQVKVRFNLKVNAKSSFDFLLSGGSEGHEEVVNAFSQWAQNPLKIIQSAYEVYHQKVEHWLSVESPDTLFNRMVQQTLAGTDRFFAETPGIGASLLAGYASTAHGWDGEQPINGRPGYAWYFGRDAQWSAMALLDYGDFVRVREVLRTFARHQDVNGKIYHELTTSGAVHYDASDATPLYLILAGRYLLHTGDLTTITELWPSLRKAIDFCYSTDTDGDLLIENTGVGHGWVEGGHLFGGKTTLYLASCWAEALRFSSIIAQETGNLPDASRYQSDHLEVLKQVRHGFVNSNGGWLNHSLKPDGSFIEDETIMQAIPLLFSQVDPIIAAKIIKRFATVSFSSDWGTRIVPKESPRFNPRGYHSGSVWPLYTGWTALAEYASGNPLQGFDHLWNNLWITQFWGQGMIEEVMHGSEFRPSGVCAHQCWSHSLTIQAIIEGLLGIDPDALHQRVLMKPALPAQWDWLKTKNLRVGTALFDLEIKRKGNTFSYRFTKTAGESLSIVLDPQFASTANVKKVLVNSVLCPKDTLLNLLLSESLLVEMEFDPIVEVVPLEYRPLPGQLSTGLRVVEQRRDGDSLLVEVQCYVDCANEIRLRHPSGMVLTCEGADLVRREAEFSTWRVTTQVTTKKADVQDFRLVFRVP
ncbi:MAG: hypothetical protein PHU33_02225 [Bacteroidales bacterium]|nr:hypothetical protein [Bacteroidales bacterium]